MLKLYYKKNKFLYLVLMTWVLNSQSRFGAQQQPAPENLHSVNLQKFIETPLHKFFYDRDNNLIKKDYVKGYLIYFPYSNQKLEIYNIFACSLNCAQLYENLRQAEELVLGNQTKKIKITNDDRLTIQNLYNQYTRCCRECRTGKC
jgi:hypothetical protein